MSNAKASIADLCSTMKKYFLCDRKYVAPTPEQVATAERQLDLKLPSDYIWYLQESATIRTPFQVLKVSPNNGTEFPTHDIVDNTLWRRKRATKPLPKRFIIFRCLGERGDYHAFDSSQPYGDQDPTDYAIVRIEYTKTGIDVEPIAPNFRSWLEIMVKEHCQPDQNA
jgi:SMI1-KNR4 cell-wall